MRTPIHVFNFKSSHNQRRISGQTSVLYWWQTKNKTGFGTLGPISAVFFVWVRTYIPGFIQVRSSLERYNRKTPPQPPKVNAMLTVWAWNSSGLWGRVPNNQLCQISARSVQGFWSPRWPKVFKSHWPEVSPLKQCYALRCYTVIVIQHSSCNNDPQVSNVIKPSSLYLISTSSPVFTLPLKTRCIINTSSSYVMSSLWIGIQRISSPRETLITSRPTSDACENEEPSVSLFLAICNINTKQCFT